MGDNTNTSSTSTAPTDPNVTKTADQLLKGVRQAYAAGPDVYNKSLYAGVGDTTKKSWSDSLKAANNPKYAAGINGAIGSYAATAAGKNIGVQAPGYQTLRNKLSNDVLTSTNGAFNNSGLFGSDTNQTAAASGLADSLGGLDYQQYQNGLDRQAQAVPILQQLYGAAQQPAAVEGAVGAARDANSQAKLLANNDLFRRQKDAKTNLLAQLSGILQGNAQTTGSTSTNLLPATPLWQTLLGLTATAL